MLDQALAQPLTAASTASVSAFVDCAAGLAGVVPGFAVAGDYRTCGEVGGDYFDFVPMADGSIATVIADVSGHNPASGMMMVSVRAMLRTLAGRQAGAGKNEPKAKENGARHRITPRSLARRNNDRRPQARS